MRPLITYDRASIFIIDPLFIEILEKEISYNSGAKEYRSGFNFFTLEKDKFIFSNDFYNLADNINGKFVMNFSLNRETASFLNANHFYELGSGIRKSILLVVYF